MSKPFSGARDIGQRLKQARSMTRLSPDEFAHRLDISEESYLDYEVGKNEMSSSLIAGLILNFSIDPVWLLTGIKRDSIAENSAAATAAYKAILEAAQRAQVTLAPEVFAYAISAAFLSVLNREAISETHADILVKLAIINSKK